jgi:hypothetical protein
MCEQNGTVVGGMLADRRGANPYGGSQVILADGDGVPAPASVGLQRFHGLAGLGAEQDLTTAVAAVHGD